MDLHRDQQRPTTALHQDQISGLILRGGTSKGKRGKEWAGPQMSLLPPATQAS